MNTKIIDQITFWVCCFNAGFNIDHLPAMLGWIVAALASFRLFVFHAASETKQTGGKK